MNTELKLDFQLLGTSIPPKEITHLTGITPDTALLKGERNAKLILPRLNIWSVESHSNSDSLADHWSELESLLSGSTESIRDIATTGIARLTVVINNTKRIPPLTIPASMSKFASQVNAEIDIDHLQS